MSSSSITNSQSPEIFPQLDVLGEDSEFLVAGDIGQQSKLSKGLSVAFPKLHALFTTNLAAAKEANLAINTRVLNEVKFNELIDAAIKKLDVKEGEAGYMNPTSIIETLARLIFNLGPALNSKFQSVFQDADIADLTPEEIKTRLITAKINAQSFAGGVVRLTNIAESLTRTALQSKKVEWTNLGAKLGAFRDERDLKIASAYRECRKDFDLLDELETLLKDLSAIDNRTPAGDIDVHFHHFVALTEVMKELYGTGHELTASVKDLLDQLDDSPESKINFYNDLLKPESDYLKILLRSVVFARRKFNEKAPQLNLAYRGMRSEKFDKFNLRFSPKAGIIFRDIFNKINNFTCERALVSKPISWFKESLIDRSKSSVCATAGIVAGVGLYFFSEVGKAVFALIAASTAYVACSIIWLVVVGGRFMIGQGYDRLKDEFQKKNQVRNSSNELQGKINSQTRPNELLTGLRTTEFYQAYEAKKEAEAEEARILKEAEAEAAKIIRDGEEADKFLAQFQGALAAIAAANELKASTAKGVSLHQSLQASRNAGAAARANPELMSRSMRQLNFGRE